MAPQGSTAARVARRGAARSAAAVEFLAAIPYDPGHYRLCTVRETAQYVVFALNVARRRERRRGPLREGVRPGGAGARRRDGDQQLVCAADRAGI